MSIFFLVVSARGELMTLVLTCGEIACDLPYVPFHWLHSAGAGGEGCLALC